MAALMPRTPPRAAVPAVMCNSYPCFIRVAKSARRASPYVKLKSVDFKFYHLSSRNRPKAGSPGVSMVCAVHSKIESIYENHNYIFLI